MRALLLLLVVACGAPQAEPSVVPVTTVDGGGIDASGPSAPVTTAELQSLAQQRIDLTESILSKCAARLSQADLVRVKESQASGYADRDELTMRDRSNNWQDRDKPSWAKTIRADIDALRAIAPADCR